MPLDPQVLQWQVRCPSSGGLPELGVTSCGGVYVDVVMGEEEGRGADEEVMKEGGVVRVGSGVRGTLQR